MNPDKISGFAVNPMKIGAGVVIIMAMRLLVTTTIHSVPLLCAAAGVAGWQFTERAHDS